MRVVAVDLFSNWLDEPPVPNTVLMPSLPEQMQRYCGSMDSGVTNLATNPDYLEDFGYDSLGDH